VATKEVSILNDSGCERSVLSGILNHGADLLIDIEEILDTKDFHWAINQKIFAIIKHLVHEKGLEKFDIPTITANAIAINYDKFNGNTKESEYLEALFANCPTPNNTKSIALSVYKLSLARQGHKCLSNVLKDIEGINGSEKIDAIISKIENPIFEFTGQLNSKDKGLVLVHSNLEERLKTLSESPKDIAGLPTGFPNWDQCIGGGLRKCTVNVVGARAKGAKSFFCINVARNMAELGIPVLYLDTELDQQMQSDRLTSLVSGIDLTHIETGKFASVKEEAEAVWDSIPEIKKLLITHTNIAGQSIESTLSLARRWLIKNVGFLDNGLTKPCLIIYDYLKLMDSEGLKANVQETQLLGFLMTTMHNFAVKWGLPILATVQLNRDGVEREGSEVISGSDRILWLCSNFTILKGKTQEEFVEDPPSNGTKKLIVCDTRFGPGMDKGDYVNVLTHLNVARLKEGKMLSHLVHSFINTKIT